MDELIKEIPLFTALIFFIVALRMILQSEQYKLPVFNYLNFSNLLTASFDIIRGLVFYIAPVVFFQIWKKWFTGYIKDWPWWVFGMLLIASGTLFVCGYRTWEMTFKKNMVVKGLFELTLFLIGILLYRCPKVDDFQVVKLALGSVFIYGYMKINGKHEVYMTAKTAKDRKVRITFKNEIDGEKTLEVNGVFTNTMEFVFIQNAADEDFSVIPMSEIRSIQYIKK